MLRCKYCGKTGIFLKVTNNGLCDNCDPFVIADIVNRSRIHNDSISLIEISDNPDVVYSRINQAIENLYYLYEYEKKEIVTIIPVPSKILEVFKDESDNFLFDSFIRANNLLTVKVLNLKSNSAKRNHLQKFVEQIDKYLLKVNNKEEFIKLQQSVEKQIRSIPVEINTKIIQPPKSIPLSFSTSIISKEIHPGKLLFIAESSKNKSGNGYSVNINLNMSGNLKIEFIGPEEPSLIYKDLSVVKPKDPNSIEPLSYYPSYFELNSEQRWIYLNWLNDITEEIDIGYVFLYYYGLERNLLIGDFEAAFNEILLLRKYYTNRSFEAYSYNALLFSSVYQNQFDKAQYVIENESKNGIDNVDLLFKFRFEKNITAEELITLAKKIKGVNLRYIKLDPIRYKTALSIILSEKFGTPDYPIYSLCKIDEISKQQTIAFANISFPTTIRLPELPNFLNHLPFVINCSEIFKDTHELVKEDLKKEHQNQ